MKKYVLGLVLVLALTGCGNNKDEAKQSNKSNDASSEVVRKESSTNESSTVESTFDKSANGADYNTTDAEAALNAGEDLVGKTVEITVDKYEPASAFGYNIMTGEHLNFVSPENPNVKIGDTLTVKVVKVASTMGSFVITYEKV